MNVNKWRTTRTSSNVLPTTYPGLVQALPPSLSAPTGWESEVLHSLSPVSNSIGTNLPHRNIRFSETLNTSDACPTVLYSTNEANRIVNEIPSSTILPSTTISSHSINEYINTPTDGSFSQEQQTINTNVDNLQQSPPLILHKKIPNNTVTYQQNVSVRYLQPPTPPPPGPIIIREVRPPPPPIQSPVQIRQRPPPPATPPPLVIRERPPPAPPRLPSQVVEKLLPPPPRPPRRLIVERFAECPPKPSDVFIERWLPYRRSDRRQILFERAPAPYIPRQEPNLIILHDQPHARVHKEFINQGVVRADPQSYLQRYGPEIDSGHTNSQYAHLVGEAARTLPAPPILGSTSDHREYHSSHLNGYQSPPPLSNLSTIWDRMKSASPLPPHPILDHHDYPRYDPSSRYSAQSPLNYHDYASHRGDIKTMVDVSPSWGRTCRSYLPSYDFSSSYPAKNIQVNSNGELQHVLSGLSNDHVSASFNSY